MQIQYYKIQLMLIKHVNVNNISIIVSAKKDYIWSSSTGICENSKFLKRIADTLLITCHETISGMHNVLTKMGSSIATNVTNTSSVNWHSKNVWYEIDCYILHTVLLVIILLLIITTICYHYPKHMSKQKSIDALTI